MPAFCLAALGLAGCGSGEDESGPDETMGEARALEEAAEMLESRRLPDEATPSGESTGAESAD